MRVADGEGGEGGARLLYGDARAHAEWRRTLRDVDALVREDEELRLKSSEGLTLKGRSLGPEVVGRLYAKYCRLVNKLYDNYLTNLQLQKLPYIQELIRTFTIRLYELRKELVNLIVSDYVFVDAALVQLHLTPQDIEVLVPFHFPLELRPESLEAVLQDLWIEGERRRNAPPPPPEPVKPAPLDDEDLELELMFTEPTEVPKVEEPKILLLKEKSLEEVEPTEEFLKVMVIQQHERYRQFHIPHNRRRLARERLLRGRPPSPPGRLKVAASTYIQHCYREYMQAKRQAKLSYKRDLLLGMITPSYSPALKLEDQNRIRYTDRMCRKKQLLEKYWEDFESEKTRLVVWKKDGVIDDITAHIRDWLRYWYTDYVLPQTKPFPEYPFEADGGTLLVIRGDFQTVEERVEEDGRLAKATKGKTKDTLKKEKEQEKQAEVLRKEAELEKQKKEAEALFKMRCDPRADPGHVVQQSKSGVAEVLRNYQLVWRNMERFPPELFAQAVTGYMKELLSEDIMAQMHKECRIYVDEFMRLELKLLVNALKAQYKIWSYKYPKERNKRPPVVKETVPVVMDDANREKITVLFEKEIVQKPRPVKVKDVIGDYSFRAYECCTKDPDVTYPLSYGDVRRRIILSCAFGACPNTGAPRRRSVLLLGPPSHGKRLLADTVCGELNALKFDLSPEVFNRKFKKPSKMLKTVCLAAKLLQPVVIYIGDIERVFAKKVPREQRSIKPGSLKKALGKVLLNNIADEDKVIFIATCSDPSTAKARPMARLFDEVILIPRTDYATAHFYLYNALMSCHSVPRDFNVQPIAQVLQGYGLGTIMKVFSDVMTPDRIVKLHVEPLRHEEFFEPLILSGEEPYTEEDYQYYVNWYLKNTHLGKKREEYNVINRKRAEVYSKLEKMAKEEE